MASNWMFNNGLDDDEEPSSSSKRMSRKQAKKIIHVYENHTYGGYVYDDNDYKEARKVIPRK